MSIFVTDQQEIDAEDPNEYNNARGGDALASLVLFMLCIIGGLYFLGMGIISLCEQMTPALSVLNVI